MFAPTVLCTCPQYVDERFIAPGLRLFQGENLDAVILSHTIYLDEQPAGSWMVLSGLCALAVEAILRWMNEKDWAKLQRAEATKLFVDTFLTY